MQANHGVQVDSHTHPDEINENAGTILPLEISPEERPLEEIFQNIVNWRDIGLNYNQDTHSIQFKPGKLFRSGRLDNASTDDLRALTLKYNIKCVIDLRSETEGRMGEDLVNTFPAAAISEQLSKYPVGESKFEEEIKVDHHIVKKEIHSNRVTYHINFAGRRFRYYAVWKPLKFRQKAEVLYMMASGKKAEVITFIGQQVLHPQGLFGLNQNFIDHCGTEIASALKLMRNPKHFPMLVHCTQGKDRTGLVIALTLSLCGASDEAIIQDYARSQDGLEPQRPIMIEEMRQTGLGPEFSDAPPEVMRMTLEYIRRKYKSIMDYLIALDLKEDDFGAIRSNLLMNSGHIQ
jgi:protein tyrosine/serine phosphatase